MPKLTKNALIVDTAKLLASIEWANYANPVGKCPSCGGKSSRGHKQDCQLAALRIKLGASVYYSDTN